jgi:hypothetical protein
MDDDTECGPVVCSLSTDSSHECSSLLYISWVALSGMAWGSRCIGGRIGAKRQTERIRQHSRSHRIPSICSSIPAIGRRGRKHRRLNDDQWHDFIVILDDATSEIYHAQLVPEESTRTVMMGLREVIETRGLFCALYSDRGSHFFVTVKAGNEVDKRRTNPSGKSDEGVGDTDDRSLLAAGAGPLRAQLRNVAGTSSARTAPGIDHDGGRGQRVPDGVNHHG